MQITMTPRQLLTRFFALLVIAFICLQLFILMEVLWLRHHQPHSSAFMQEQLADLREHSPHARLDAVWRDYTVINSNIKHAVIAAEDSTFMSNDGFDWEGIQHAMTRNLKAGEVVAGGSTITQQLAKNLFLSGHRTLVRKGEETLITLMLDACLSKRRILELYLNYAQWGRNVFGIEAASRHYYGISANALSDLQAARLAAMLPSPSYYDRVGDTDWLLEKTGIILARMPMVATPR
jgi:monofunctional biosynthetic peptidoglycan transglycosylase